jgi:hypothetical protein
MGNQTTLVVPNLPIQMLSPRAGDVVTIPQPASGTVGMPAATPPPPQEPERAPDQTASLAVRYTLPALPSVAIAHVIRAYAQWPSTLCPSDGSNCDSPHCVQAIQCGYILVGTPIRQAGAIGTQTMTIADYGYSLGAGFESFQPGPGRVGLYINIQWDAAKSGFAGVQLALDSKADVQITWARP